MKVIFIREIVVRFIETVTVYFLEKLTNGWDCGHGLVHLFIRSHSYDRIIRTVASRNRNRNISVWENMARYTLLTFYNDQFKTLTTILSA